MRIKSNQVIEVHVGDRFNNLVVLEKAYDIPYGNLWLCQCDCGLKQDILEVDLLQGNITSCEKCSHLHISKKKETTLEKYGDLTLLFEVLPSYTSKGRLQQKFCCKCICGNLCIAYLKNLKSGKTFSCGCQVQSVSRLKRIWKGILVRTDPQKCTNPSVREAYINRGITLCDEWKNFISFKEWSFSHGYSDILTIDRINNDLGYSPSNCRWVTMRQNSCNKRNSIRLPNGHSFSDLLWNLGIPTRSSLYRKYATYYKVYGELPQEILSKIEELSLDFSKII